MAAKDAFEENSVDQWVKYLKSTVSAVTSAMGPWAAFLSPYLSEIVASTIPNQRIDRIAAYLRFLQAQVSDDILAKLGNLPDRVALLEEGLYAAGLTPHASRVLRIASVVAHGISQDELDLDRHTHILGVIRTLSDSDVVVLHFHATSTIQEERAFVQRHMALIPNTQDQRLSADQNAFKEKLSLFRSHEAKLLAAGLLDHAEVELPNLERTFRGGDESYAISKYVTDVASAILEQGYKISSLGRLVIETIELAPSTALS